MSTYDLPPTIATILQNYQLTEQIITHGPVQTMADVRQIFPYHSPEQMIKCLVVQSHEHEDKSYVVCAIPATCQLNFAKLAQCLSLSLSALSLAKPGQVEAATGFAVGAVSPLGLPEQVNLIIDTCLSQYDTVLCGAGSHRASLVVNYELLMDITQPVVADVIEKM